MRNVALNKSEIEFDLKRGELNKKIEIRKDSTLEFAISIYDLPIPGISEIQQKVIKIRPKYIFINATDDFIFLHNQDMETIQEVGE